jgi:hypothetical protein
MIVSISNIKLSTAWDGVWPHVTGSIWDTVRDYICEFNDNMQVACDTIEAKIDI